MWELCLEQLADITDGQVRFGSLPPLAGKLAPIRRIVLNCRRVRAGDVYWDIDDGTRSTTCRAEEALMRGALGAVVSGRHIEPWAGRFVLHVENVNTQLVRVIRCCPSGARSKTFVFDQDAVRRWRQHETALEELVHQVPRQACPITS